MTRRGLVPLTAFTLVAVALLAGLGLWQLNRLEWKEALIARIEARTEAKPISLDKALALAKEGRNVSYYRVEVEGRYHHERERYLYSISEGQPGWHVITPLETVDGDMVLIDRGFVPDEFKEPSTREAGQPEEVVTVIGLARPPEIETLFTQTTNRRRTAGSGGISPPWRAPCFQSASWTSLRPFTSSSRRTTCRADGQRGDRRDWRLSTTICNTP